MTSTRIASAYRLRLPGQPAIRFTDRQSDLLAGVDLFARLDRLIDHLAVLVRVVDPLLPRLDVGEPPLAEPVERLLPGQAHDVRHPDRLAAVAGQQFDVGAPFNPLACGRVRARDPVVVVGGVGALRVQPGLAESVHGVVDFLACDVRDLDAGLFDSDADGDSGASLYR